MIPSIISSVFCLKQVGVRDPGGSSCLDWIANLTNTFTFSLVCPLAQTKFTFQPQDLGVQHFVHYLLQMGVRKLLSRYLIFEVQMESLLWLNKWKLLYFLQRSLRLRYRTAYYKNPEKGYKRQSTITPLWVSKIISFVKERFVYSGNFGNILTPLLSWTCSDENVLQWNMLFWNCAALLKAFVKGGLSLLLQNLHTVKRKILPSR